MSLDKNLIARMLFKEFCPSQFLKLDFTNFSWENPLSAWAVEGENVKTRSMFGYCC